jgi:hypothetical protein
MVMNRDFRVNEVIVPGFPNSLNIRNPLGLNIEVQLQSLVNKLGSFSTRSLRKKNLH